MGGRKILFVSIVIGLSYWVIDSAVDAYIFNEDIFLSQLIAPEVKELWTRLFAMFALVTAGVFAQREINKRTKMEKALLEEKNRTEAIIAAIGDGISIQGTNYKILYQNQVYKDIVGDHIGEYCYKAYQKRDNVCDNCHLGMSFEDGNIHREEQSSVTDEGKVYLEITSSPLKDSAGRIVAGIEVVRDITERKQIEEALRVSEESFRRIFEDGPLGMVLASPDYRILKANKAICGMLGSDEAELVGRGLQEITYPEDLEKTGILLRQLLDGDIPLFHIEKRCTRKHGNILWTSLTTTTLRNQIGDLSILCMIEDISDRKLAEMERERLIQELRDAMGKIKTLRGLLPICAWCTKVHDDDGYWKKVETYVQEHSDATFTHGLCPDCLKKLDPESYEEYQKRKDGKSAAERRQCHRVRVTESFTQIYSLHSDEPDALFFNAFITDISDAGIGIQTDYPLQLNSLLVCDNGTEKKTGLVRWRKAANAKENGFRAGIEFIAN
jgi:PAS domain S-box-containing protein